MPAAPSDSPNNPPPTHDAYAAVRISDYRRFALGFVLSATGLQMLGLAVLWEIHERTDDALMLGLTGIARALPVVLLALPAGHVADRFNRKTIIVITQLAFSVLAGLLALASYSQWPVWTYYVILLLMGCTRAFNGPARGSLLPQLVPSHVFHNAVTWNSGLFHLAATLGPVAAGWMIDASTRMQGGGKHAWIVYLVVCVTSLIFSALASTLEPRIATREREPLTLRSMFAGMRHVAAEKTVFGALTLDLLAVLFGGATVLLPIYASDILHVEATGLGILRAATPIGAMIMSIWLAHRPPFQQAGRTLLLAVAAFGVATIVFGLSTNFWLSVALLGVVGAVDNISVVVRHVLVQMRTPEHLRGRVGAVNTVFIECSNELGSFESGLVAKLFSPVISVVSGGIGTILVVLGVAGAFPALRNLGPLHDVEEERKADVPTAQHATDASLAASGTSLTASR
ncbi:MAG: MFS transporter [Planctomycetota bacterium]|nr:MFS transporter [Planctomycetota bacterium]